MMHRRSFLVAATAALTVPGRGMAQVSDSLVAAAKREGELVWYTSLIVQQAVRPMVDAFEEAYPGIKVRFVRQTSADLASRILNEARAGRVQADVFDGSTTIFKLLDADLVGSYAPQAAAAYPPELRDANGQWVALNVYFLVPAYNTRLVSAKDAPRSYDDLLDPRWRGKIAWSDDPGVNGPPGFIATILETRGRDKGMEYLRRLAAQNVVKVPAAQRVTLDQTIAGEYPLALMTFNHHSAISQADGAPIEWVRIDPAIATTNYLSMTKGAPHPNAARLFMEFATSPAGQRILQQANYLPAHPDVPARVPALKPDVGKFNYFTISTELQRAKFDEWMRIYGELFR